MPARLFYCAADRTVSASPPMMGMAMNAGLSRIGSTGLADIGGSFSGRPAKTAVSYFRNKLAWLPVILLGGLGAWMVFSSHTAENQPSGKAGFVAAAPIRPTQSFEKNPVPDVTQFNPVNAPSDAAPAEVTPVDGLKISSQSWRRGGLGSKALITFTLRNDNDYAVGDIGLLCSFSRRDGSLVTERRPTIHDTVKMKSRRTFARIHVGFINITADRAKCSLLSASRV
jgi:hypothetical protein